ncbi:AraC family transcriptional regulator [Anaerocolumna aminovalerica]|uniref:AraC family transcriptional regulator n=1 Tax=Anaerocolumna aminovalerica TaxID=1527 RepID=UPI000BE31FA1|nr:AraC family transcriptional regulator [Anaerocolumna aminovalerica]
MKPLPVQDNNNIPGRPLVLYHCGHEQCKPSHSFGPAIRPHYLIHFVLHGQGTYHVNGSVYHVGEGEGFLIHPGVTTLYCADDQNPWEYCWIGFDGYDVPNLLKVSGLSHTSLILKDYSNGMLWKDLSSLILAFTERQGNELLYLSLLYRCFSHICRPEQAPSGIVYENYITRAVDYIHNNYTYDIRVADIAKFLCIDRTYLYKLFINATSLSPQKYLIQYRIKIARQLLLESDLSVSEIAYSCGFRDASSFNKHFKSHLQITPLKYRNSILASPANNAVMHHEGISF